jgi:hypothetical protein
LKTNPRVSLSGTWYDPLVSSGNPTYRNTFRPTTLPPRTGHRMVVPATSTPSRSPTILP